MGGMGDPHRADAALLGQFDPHLDRAIGRIMPEPVIGIDRGAGRSADIHLQLRFFVEPPARQHGAIVPGEAHAMAIHTHEGRMQHRPCRGRERGLARPCGTQGRRDLLLEQRRGKHLGLIGFHVVLLHKHNAIPYQLACGR
ncbi:hypothetical protein FQZ97_1117350 [compost metagenome]